MVVNGKGNLGGYGSNNLCRIVWKFFWRIEIGEEDFREK